MPSDPNATDPESAERGALYVVATPIGNLEDMGQRARRILGEVDFVVAEDTRRTRALLTHFGLSGVAVRRVDENCTEATLQQIALEIAGGKSVAQVTDAGTPSISDPGHGLVAFARKYGVRVVPVPGPSAAAAAISACGFPVPSYRFVGFLPRGGADRRKAIADHSNDPDTVVLFESPSRLSQTLADFAAITPERPALLARELTKLHEEILEAPLEVLAKRFADREVLGEITLVLGPFERRVATIDDDAIDAKIRAWLGRGSRPKDVAIQVALETGVSKSRVYARVVALREE